MNIFPSLLAGLVFGMISVLLMIPLKFDDKRAAMAGAFLNRFSIGFLIGVTVLPLDGWIKGALIGLLLSLPDAIITKAFLPITIIGVIGGAIIGAIVG